jgi:hypothetical protein
MKKFTISIVVTLVFNVLTLFFPWMAFAAIGAATVLAISAIHLYSDVVTAAMSNPVVLREASKLQALETAEKVTRSSNSAAERVDLDNGYLESLENQTPIRGAEQAADIIDNLNK